MRLPKVTLSGWKKPRRPSSVSPAEKRAASASATLSAKASGVAQARIAMTSGTRIGASMVRSWPIILKGSR